MGMHRFYNRPADDQQPDILLIGTITQDLIDTEPNGESAWESDQYLNRGYRIGGTVSFAAVTALRLGRKPTIITRAAATTDFSELSPEIDLRILPSPTTTTFVNVYTEEGRTQYTYAQSAPIHAADIADELRSPSLVLLGPLVDDVMPDVAALFDTNVLVGAVPQGWMRCWDETGRVYSKRWTNETEILPHLDVLILSQEDIDYDLSRLELPFHHVPLVVMTEYRAGSTIFRREKDKTTTQIKIPPRPANEVDPTGAGDVFAAAFLLCLQETADPIHAARFANVTASFSVEKVGTSGIPSRAAVLTYMEKFPLSPEDVIQNSAYNPQWRV